jgi:hypothetical protein
MATAYRAIVRIRPAVVGHGREEALLAAVRQHLPPGAELAAERDDQDRLLLGVTLRMSAADSSEVGIQARDAVALALQRAGLTEQAAILDDVDVKAGS